MIGLDLDALADVYAQGLRPVELFDALLQHLETARDEHVWISRPSNESILTRARELGELTGAQRARLPLFGVPFAVKDNIDVAGMPTTAGCPAFAYTPERSATVVRRLEAAGAVLVGKTNLDQFATGLVGTRSPYGVARNPFDARYIPGGSSSGSAVAVARGFVSFALGTDTAGSGRVPAAFNALVGCKPTLGILSMAGVVPACRTLDCVSIFAKTVEGVQTVLDVAAAADPRDPNSRARPAPEVMPGFDRFTFAVPSEAQRVFCGDTQAERSFARTLEKLRARGGTPVEVDLTPCFEAAQMLYGGAFVAERTAAVGAFTNAHPNDVLEVTRTIIEGGRRFSAVDAFEAMYRVRALRARAQAIFDAAQVLVVPTTPTIYRIDEIETDPYVPNANLGTYTNFVNLFDLCALAIPSDWYPSGLPLGITLVAPAFGDDRLAALAARLDDLAGPAPATPAAQR